MVTRLDAEQALRTLVDTREQYRRVWTALMGDGAGTVVNPNNPDQVFVRVHGLQSSVAAVFNKVAPTNRPDLPVLIGTTREHPHLVQVLAVDWAALPEWGGETMLPLHGDDHEVPDGCDPVYIQKRAIVPLRASPQSPPDMTVEVSPDFYPYDEGWNFFEGATSEDLTARVPGADLGCFVTIYVDGATNALAYLDGDTGIVYPLPLEEPLPIPLPPEGSVPVAAIRLRYGMSAIKEKDIYDLRIIVSPMGGTIAPAPHKLDPVHGRHTGRLDTSHLWASVACCGA